jgi:hypothetical protein
MCWEMLYVGTQCIASPKILEQPKIWNKKNPIQNEWDFFIRKACINLQQL